MESSSEIFTAPSRANAKSTSIQMLLRLEGLAVAAITVLLYAHLGVSWWLFAGLWLAPDLSMLGYLAGPCRGARIYNAAHTYAVPAVLGAWGLLLHLQMPAAWALVWANHIGVDRALGFGLKYGEGFGWTHLGRMGKQT